MTRAYVITNHLETWDTIPEAPAKLLTLAEGEKRERVEAAINIVLDAPGNVVRAQRLLRDYIVQGHIAVEGSGGDDLTYAVCAEVLNFGVSPDKAEEILQEWNDACVPPWPADELRTKIERAELYQQNSTGAWAVPPVHERIDPAALSKLLADSEVMTQEGPTSFGAVLARTVPPVQEIVAGLIERQTVTFLSAPGGSHKSRLAVQWGLSIDAGVPIFGRAVERAAFHYLSYEDHADEVARRSQAIARRLSLAADTDGQFWDLSGKDAPLAIVRESGECETRPLWNKLRSHLLASARHKFVVIDSTYNALRFEGAAKINEGAVMAGIGLLQRLCDECDCTLLVLWHPSQAGQERGDASGWSVAWHNAPRARLSLTPIKDTEDAFDLKVEKRNHGRKGKPITLYWSDGVLLPRGDTDIAEQGVRLAVACVRVAEAAAEQGYPIQAQKKLNKWMVDEIESAAGYRPTERVVKEALSLAMRDGKLRYLKGTNRRMAGYYPKDQRRAEDLAVQAKKQGAPNV